MIIEYISDHLEEIICLALGFIFGLVFKIVVDRIRKKSKDKKEIKVVEESEEEIDEGVEEIGEIEEIEEPIEEQKPMPLAGDSRTADEILNEIKEGKSNLNEIELKGGNMKWN